MPRAAVRVASVAVLIAAASRAPAEPPALVPCDELPAAVGALGSSSEIEAFGLAAAAPIAVAATTAGDGEAGSVVRFAKAGEAPRAVKVGGRVLNLAVAADGAAAYAIVQQVDRKGAVKSVELIRVDLATARVTSEATLPATARGLAIGPGGATLLVACRDEIRTFRLPGFESGPLYRTPGDNIGVAPLDGSSYVIVAQPTLIVLADLAAPQGRDGVALLQETAAPAPLRGLLASAGDAGPLAVSAGGHAWCVRAEPPPMPVRAIDPPVEPVVEAPAPAQPVVAEPTPAEPTVPEVPAVPPAPPELPAGPGTVYGVVAGPAVAEVAAVVFLGPDNVLREATRAVPDGAGRFSAPSLSPGAYRLVATGKGGRVLICEPPFITVRVGSNGAVEAPALKVLRAR